MSLIFRRFRAVSLTFVCVVFVVSVLQCTPQQQEQFTGTLSPPGDSDDSNPAIVNQFAVLAPPKADLEQIRNGSGTSATTPTPIWQNGNVNSSQAHMIEGYSIPYRCVLENMPTGVEIRLVLGYDVKHSDHHAIDYLTHFQRLEPHGPPVPFAHAAEVINPLTGVSGVNATTTTAMIPVPRVNEIVTCLPGDFSQPETSYSDLPANERLMTLYGGTINGIEYDTDGGFTGPDFAADQSEERIAVRFTLNSASAVLAWGGHIASREEWGCAGDPQSAGGISGSPYHMRRHGWTGDPSLPNLGSTDRSLSAGAIFVVDCGTCEVTGLSTVCQGTTNEYTSTITGTCESPVHDWSVTAGNCSIVGADNGASVMILAGTSSSCTIQDAISCSGCTGDPPPCELTITVNPTSTATAGDNQTLCQAASGETCFGPLAGSASGGTPSWSVQSEPSPGCVDITNGNTATPTVCFEAGCTGQATLRITVSGTAPCPDATDEVTLTVRARSTAAAGNDRTICQAASGDTCFAPLAGSASGGTPSWSVQSEPSAGCVGITNGNTTTPTVCFDAGCTGTATLRLTVTGTSPCPNATDDIDLTVTARSTAAAGDNQTLCQAVSGDTCFAPLAGSASGGTPSWSVQSEPAVGCVDITNGNTATPTVCFEAGCTGQATLRITVPGTSPCPDATDEVTLTVPARATASAGDNDTKCQAVSGETCFGPLAGSASGGTPSWSVQSEPSVGCVDITNGNTATPTVCFEAGCTGQATLRITVPGTSPCPNATDEVTLTVRARSTAAAGDDDTKCQAASGETCFGPLAGSGSNGTPSWSVVSEPSPNCVDITNGDTYTPTVCFAAANCTGSATLRLTVTGTSPCPNATDLVVLRVNENPQCSIPIPNPLPPCRTMGNELTATIEGGSGDYTLHWTLDSTDPDWIITDGQGTSTITFNTGENVVEGTFTLVVTDNVTGCRSECTRTFECDDNQAGCLVNPPTGFSCDDGMATFCARAISGLEPFSITWFDSSDVMLESCSGLLLNETCCLSVMETAEGTYGFHAEVSDGGSTPSMARCDATLQVGTCEEFCSLTQGAYGNAGGTFNGVGTLELIQSLLAADLTVGKSGRSVTIQQAAAQCIIDRMPTGGTAMALPSNLGDPTLNPVGCETSPVALPKFANNGRWKNILLGQVITLALNMRLDPMLPNFTLPDGTFCTQATLPGEDGLHGGIDNDDELDPGPDGVFGCNAEGVNDDPIQQFAIPPSVLTALTNLGLSPDVAGLLELGNRALAGDANLGGATLGAITAACDTINQGFDECRIIVPCPEPCPPPPMP